MNAKVSVIIKMKFSHLHGTGRALRPSPGGLPKTDSFINAKNYVFTEGLFPYLACKDCQSEEADLVQCRHGKDNPCPAILTALLETSASKCKVGHLTPSRNNFHPYNRYDVKSLHSIFRHSIAFCNCTEAL